ncbi:MAG: hypothetical protein SGBAC_007654 [Bacillariaceae sp.]
MTVMAVQESSDPSINEAPTSAERVKINQKPMQTVSIWGDDNDVSSYQEYNFDPKSALCASVTTAESTLPTSGSDCSFNSSQYDHGSPVSPISTARQLKTPQTPKTPLQQQLPLSAHSTHLTILKSPKTPTMPQTPQTLNSQTPEKPLSKAQSIRERRRLMEAWHTEQKSKSVMSIGTASTIEQPLSPFSPSSSKKQKLTLGARKTSSLAVGSKRRGTKEEMARYSRMVDRILDAEKQSEKRIRQLSRIRRHKDARERTLAMREGAELKLRVSQMEKARDFYEALIAAKMIEAIPMQILKTINALPKYQPKPKMTLTEELEAHVKLMQKEDPEESGYMFQEIRDWKDSADLALEVGATAPDFVLDSHTGKQVDSKTLRQQWRIILVFYHDYDSPMCKMNLVALQKLKKTFEGEGAKMIGIGFEADTRDTAEETEVTFPLLADEVGILATKFGIIRGEEMPILSTFIIDTDGSILWRYVNKDYTKRPEPMDILEALPEKSKTQRSNKRRLMFRKPKSIKKK